MLLHAEVRVGALLGLAPDCIVLDGTEDANQGI